MHPHRPARLTSAAVAAVALLAPPALAQPAGAKSDATAFFRAQVRPLLEAKCLSCHGADKKKGGLDLSRRAGALAGGDSGPALVPGKSAESLLYRRVVAKEMPPQNPLSARQAEVLQK